MAIAAAIGLSGCSDEDIAASSPGPAPNDGADASRLDAGTSDDTGTLSDTSPSGDTSLTGSDTSGDTSTDNWHAPNVCEPLAESLAASSATHTVGEGPGTCDADTLRDAIDEGGVIGFDCGPSATITLEAPLDVRTDVALLGEGHITLEGTDSHRLIHLIGRRDDDTPHLRLYGVTLTGGRAPKQSNSEHLASYDGSGGAILNVEGQLTVSRTRFVDNHAVSRGLDVAGGAIYSVRADTTRIDESLFEGHTASNGGAIGQTRTPLSIADSRFADNQATGTGGAAGYGGNGGAIHMTGSDGTLSLCGTTIEDNQASAYGGGLFRTAYELQPTTRIHESSIRDNHVYQTDPSLGGGLHVTGTHLDVSRTSFTGNRAGGAGGLFVGEASRLTAVNTTIADNVAAKGLGGGLSVGKETTGRLSHVTIAGNRAGDSNGFAAGIHNGVRLDLQNSIIAYQRADNAYSPLSCRPALKGGSGSIQFPRTRSNGAEDPKCAPAITFADPRLGSLTDHKRAVGEVRIPSDQSPAIGFAANCPDRDQLGRPRSMPCTAGAVEVARGP